MNCSETWVEGPNAALLEQSGIIIHIPGKRSNTQTNNPNEQTTQAKGQSRKQVDNKKNKTQETRITLRNAV